MHNDPQLQQQGKYLGEITKDFVVVADTLKEAAYQLTVRNFEFPIFPIAKVEISLGQLLISKKDLAISWDYNISYLEEFVQRQLVTSDHIDNFKKSYKDPNEFCCLFVIDQEFTKFVYVPYPVDDNALSNT